MSGTLTALGLLEDGKLTNLSRQAFLDDVLAGIASTKLIDNPLMEEVFKGIEGGELLTTLSTPVAIITTTYFGNPRSVTSHREQFPTYHEFFVDGLYESVANFFDMIPASAVLKMSIPPLFDPTEPVLIIINLIEQKILEFRQLMEEIPDIITRFISYVTTKIAEICLKISQILIKGINAVKELIEYFMNLVIEFLNSIMEKFEPIKEKIQAVIDAVLSMIEKIEEWINEIKQKVIDWILSFLVIPELPDISPYINIKIPPFGLPGLDLRYSLAMPPIQFKIEFFKLILDIIMSLPTLIADLIAAILQGIEAIIKFLMETFLGKIIKFILKYLGAALAALVVPVASFVTVLKKITPMFIVSIIGWLIGPGLFADGVARMLGLK